MNVCTAVGAIDSKKNYTITFKSEAHKIFYLKYLPECRYQDVYHKALVYCLGIDADTRNHVNSIYDFKTGSTMYRTLPGIRKYSKTGQKDSCNAYISHICSVEEKNKNLFYLSG